MDEETKQQLNQIITILENPNGVDTSTKFAIIDFLKNLVLDKKEDIVSSD